MPIEELSLHSPAQWVAWAADSLKLQSPISDSLKRAGFSIHLAMHETFGFSGR